MGTYLGLFLDRVLRDRGRGQRLCVSGTTKVTAPRTESGCLVAVCDCSKYWNMILVTIRTLKGFPANYHSPLIHPIQAHRGDGGNSCLIQGTGSEYCWCCAVSCHLLLRLLPDQELPQFRRVSVSSSRVCLTESLIYLLSRLPCDLQ